MSQRDPRQRPITLPDPGEMSPAELLEHIQMLWKILARERGHWCATAYLALKEELKKAVPLFTKWATQTPACTVHQKIIDSSKFAKHRKLTPKELMKHLQKLDKQRLALAQEEAATYQLLASWALRLERHL